MKYWHRRLHFMLWLVLTPCLILAFGLSAYLLEQSKRQPDLQQQEILNRIEQELNNEEELNNEQEPQ